MTLIRGSHDTMQRHASVLHWRTCFFFKLSVITKRHYIAADTRLQQKSLIVQTLLQNFSQNVTTLLRQFLHHRDWQSKQEIFQTPQTHRWDVTAGCWGGGRRYRQLSGWQMFLKKKTFGMIQASCLEGWNAGRCQHRSVFNEVVKSITWQAQTWQHILGNHQSILSPWHWLPSVSS